MAEAWSWSEIWQGYLWPLLLMAFWSVLLLVGLLVSVAFLLLMDRKVWAAVQLRRGPNVVGPFGLLQSFADLLKFVLKEPLVPAGSDKGVFLLAPLVASVLALAAWAVIPVNDGSWGRWVISDLNVGIPISLPSPRSASMASSWAGGRRTRNTPSSDRSGPRRRWYPTRSPSVS
jgi:NADH-quinone oxidoreductase subunit H